MGQTRLYQHQSSVPPSILNSTLPFDHLFFFCPTCCYYDNLVTWRDKQTRRETCSAIILQLGGIIISQQNNTHTYYIAHSVLSRPPETWLPTTLVTTVLWWFFLSSSPDVLNKVFVFCTTCIAGLEKNPWPFLIRDPATDWFFSHLTHKQTSQQVDR